MKILRFILREKNVLRDLIFLSFYFLSFKEERRRGFFIPPSGWTRSRLDTIIIFPLFEAKLRFQFYSPVPFFITLVCKSSSFESFPASMFTLFTESFLPRADVITPLQPGHGISLPICEHTHTISFAYNEAVHYTGGKELHIFRQTSFLVNLASSRGGGGGGGNLMDELAREYFHGRRRLRVRVGWLNANHDLRHEEKRGKAWIAGKKGDFSSPSLFIMQRAISPCDRCVV